MSNKDINKQIVQKSVSEEIIQNKDTMHLFSLSLLKSKSKITLSRDYNSFHIDFSKNKDKDNFDYIYNKKTKESIEKKNNRKISIIEGDNTSSLKTLNIEVPSSDFLSQEKFKNDFMNEYDTSFANYCGINKKQFSDIYIKNRYIPILDEFGDISISIKYIMDLLKTYPINIKAGNKIIKRNRIKKIFKTQRKKNEKLKKNRLLFEVKKNEAIKKIKIREYIQDINDIKANETKSINQEIDNKKIEGKKENYNNINNIKNKVLSKYGNISIPNKSHNISQDQKIQTLLNKSGIRAINPSSLGLGNHMNMTKSILGNNNFIFPCNTLSNDKQHINLNINNNPTTSFGLNLSALKQMTPANNNNNYFNFSKNIIQNYNYGNITNNNNMSNNNILTNNANTLGYNLLNINSPNNNMLISPRIFSNNLLSPPLMGNSNISTPRLSPGLNNNLLDIFSYNNNNIPSFLLGNNTSTPLKTNLNNNMVSNSIINSGIKNNNVMENNNMNNIMNNNMNNNMNNIMNNNMNNIMNNSMNNIMNNNNVNNNMSKLMRKNISKNLKINIHMNNSN